MVRPVLPNSKIIHSHYEFNVATSTQKLKDRTLLSESFVQQYPNWWQSYILNGVQIRVPNMFSAGLSSIVPFSWKF